MSNSVKEIHKIEDMAQKRIVELGITEHAQARRYEQGYWDGYIQGELDTVKRATDVMLENAKKQLGKKKGSIPDAEVRPIGPDVEKR
jgi:hypothetical protein